MNQREIIIIFALLILGSVSIITWLITGDMLFNTIGLVLLGFGLGWFLGLRALKL